MEVVEAARLRRALSLLRKFWKVLESAGWHLVTQSLHIGVVVICIDVIATIVEDSQGVVRRRRFLSSR